MKNALARAICLLATIWLVSFSAPAAASCTGQFGAFEGCETGSSAGTPGPVSIAGSLRNSRIAKTAGYTLSAADCRSTLALGGSAYYDLTINAASGYAATCAILATNTDSGRAKRLVINGLSNCVLWPLQTAMIYNDNNTWRSTCGSRWRIASGLTLYIDPTGSDANNDGLSPTGNGPFATLQKAFDVAKQSLDQGGTLNVTVSASAGTFTCGNDCIHMDNLPPGSNGAGTFTVTGQGGCGGSTIFVATTGTPFQVFYSANLLIQNLRVRGSGNGISASRGGRIQVNGDVDFADTGGSQIVAFDHGSILVSGTNCISQSAYSYIQAGNLGYISHSGATIEVNNSITYTLAFAQVQGAGAFGQFSSTTIDLNGNTVSGQRFYVTDLGYLTSSTGTASTYFPGSGSTHTTNGDVDGVVADIITAQMPAFGSGDVSFAADGGAGTIANDAVTNAKLANMANATFKCRTTAGTGDPEDCTVAQSQVRLQYPRILLGSLTAANLTSGTTDLPVTITSPTTNYRVDTVYLSNANASLATATAGLFTSTGGGGLQLCADQALAAITATAANTAGNGMAMSCTNSQSWLNASSLQFRVGTGQAATVNVSIYGIALP